jgi:toxin-antitoxin system PIN domain toxin
MSATVDTNVLVYASDTGSRRREGARKLLDDLAAGPDLVYLFWPVLSGYLRIVTHPGIFAEPLTPADALGNLEAFIDRPHVRTPGEQDGFWSVFRHVVDGDVVRGNLFTDAHIVALMRQHGVRTIWSADRDFRRFDDIEPRSPF